MRQIVVQQERSGEIRTNRFTKFVEIGTVRSTRVRGGRWCATRAVELWCVEPGFPAHIWLATRFRAVVVPTKAQNAGVFGKMYGKT